MMRERTEIKVFTPKDLDAMARFAAKMAIIGDLFAGNFVSQKTRWTEEGSVEVITKYVQGDLHDLDR